jgi:hypothetical protein
MTDPTPLDDAALDRLLGHHEAPPLPAGFADRVLAEAAREDRPVSVPPLPPKPRSARRAWTRRGLWAGVVAFNLIVASAIAATITGVPLQLAHVAAAAAQVFHIHHREAPVHHVAPHPVHRVSAPPMRPMRPMSMMPAARPLLLPHAPMALPPGLPMHPAWHPPHRFAPFVHPRRMMERRPFALRPRLQRPAPRAVEMPKPPMAPALAPQDRAGPSAFDRPQWGEGGRRTGPGWREQIGRRMQPWRRGGPRGWRRAAGGGGGGGGGWHRPFGRGRRF